MTTLNPPNTVPPVVNFKGLRITKDEKEQRPAYVLKPELKKYHAPLNEYAALFDDEPRIMSLEEVRKGPNPAYVPFAMNRKIGDDEPGWERPPSPKKSEVDVSTAEVVEQRVPRAAPLYDSPPKTKIVAYDDTDPYVSRMRRLREISSLERDNVRLEHCEVYLLGTDVCVFNVDMTSIWVLDNTRLGTTATWQRYPCIGQPPPIGTMLLPNQSDRTFTAISAPDWYVLELLPGEPDAKWVRCKLKGDWDVFTVTWQQVIEDDTFYIRSDTQHAMVTPIVKSAKRRGQGQIFLHSIANTVISPHEELCAISRIRSEPVREKLVPVEGLPATAIQHCMDHLWVFVYTPKARNYLPIQRVDVISPLSCMMPGRGLYLFSHPSKKKGAIAKRSLQATHRLSAPVLDHRGMPSVTIHDATKDGEVTLNISPDQVGCLSPMHDSCVLVLARDLENYVVVEVDRFEKLRKYTSLNPGDRKKDGTLKSPPPPEMMRDGANLSQTPPPPEISIDDSATTVAGGGFDPSGMTSVSRSPAPYGGAGNRSMSLHGGDRTPPPPPLPPEEEADYFNTHYVDASKLLAK